MVFVGVRAAFSLCLAMSLDMAVMDNLVFLSANVISCKATLSVSSVVLVD